jgi:RNA polymerase sigma-70 factor (ECF subfamily)
MNELDLIHACKRNDPKAQKLLYDKFSPMLFGICRRYIKGQEDAEDVFVHGMFKILTKIKGFREAGSFEGWMKRIMVNESLMFLRKSNNFNLVVEMDRIKIPSPENIIALISEREILELVDQLPTGYRTIFNLYVIEGYKHREIAEKLGISINTSKSQLILAKKKMQILLKKNKILKQA